MRIKLLKIFFTFSIIICSFLFISTIFFILIIVIHPRSNTVFFFFSPLVQVEVRPMMYVALTYDHRLIDGREAVTFLRKIKSVIEDPRVLLLDM